MYPEGVLWRVDLQKQPAFGTAEKATSEAFYDSNHSMSSFQVLLLPFPV
jgi:hypothetical protein